MSGHHSQTLLSHFLKYGAAAASGTVAEPFANAPKFPNSRLFVHYASGCNVAESFYQSLLSPYQMLIVGDPLCQPWAVPPTVKIRGLNTRKRHSGNISFQVEALSKQNQQIRSIETYIDCKLLQRTLPGDPIQLDTRKVNNGYHELRVVAVEDTPIETQGRQITGFVTSNHPPTEDSAKETHKPLGVASAVTPSNALWRDPAREQRSDLHA